MTILLRTIAFGLMGGVFSVAATFLTVGFKHQTFDELLWVGCLFVVACIASAGLYRANPENAWDLFTIWKKIIPTPPEVKKILLVALALGMTACATKTTEVVKDPPLNTNQCEALTGAAYKASSANDAGSAAIFMHVAKRGGCF